MTVKPKTSPFVLLGLVLALGYVGLVTLAIRYVQRPTGWGTVALPLLLIAVVGLTLKWAWDYKVIVTEKRRLLLRQPLLGRTHVFLWTDLRDTGPQLGIGQPGEPGASIARQDGADVGGQHQQVSQPKRDRQDSHDRHQAEASQQTAGSQSPCHRPR